MITENDIVIIEDIKKYISSNQEITTIIENTVNTWQKQRTVKSKYDDTKLGKLAENIFASYIKQNMEHITYLSYDDIREDNFEKHAPFDGLVFNNINTDTDMLKNIINRINKEISINSWGKISDKLKLDCYKQHIYIVEVKSTRVTNRHKDKNSVILKKLIKDDFLEYPKYIRVDKTNSINSFNDYINFCKKYRNFKCSTDCIKKIKEEEKDNMRHIYARVYIDEKLNKAYIIGCISNQSFIKKANIKKMPQKNKSEFAIYLAVPLVYGVHINNIAKIK